MGMASTPYSPFRTLSLNPEPQPLFSPQTLAPHSLRRKSSVRSQSHLDLSPDIAARLRLDRPAQSLGPVEPEPEAVVGPAVTFVPQPKRARKNVLLFYCEEMSDLARRVVAESDAIEL